MQNIKNVILFTESSRNFSINTHDWEGRIENSLFLGHDKLEVLAHSLKIVDTHGAVLFSTDKNEVVIGANSLRIDGEGGTVFKESVQTPLVRAEPARELKFVDKNVHMNDDFFNNLLCFLFRCQ